MKFDNFDSAIHADIKDYQLFSIFLGLGLVYLESDMDSLPKELIAIIVSIAAIGGLSIGLFNKLYTEEIEN